MAIRKAHISEWVRVNPAGVVLECEYCGYPGLGDVDDIDSGAVWTIDDDGPLFCSKRCAVRFSGADYEASDSARSAGF